VKRITPPAPRSNSIIDLLRVSSEGFLWLGVAVVVAFLGWWKSISIVFLLATFMLALVLINGVVARLHVRRVRVALPSVPPVFVGEDILLRTLASNVSSLGASVSVSETIAGETHTWFLSNLPAGAAAPCHSQRQLQTRGVHAAQVRIASGYPLGLVAYYTPPHIHQLLVLPALGVIDSSGMRRWIQRQTGSDDRVRRTLRTLSSEQADIRGVRQYRPGDAMRSVHWRTSARRGELMVREFDSAQATHLVVVVEPWLPDRPTARERASVEAALSLAATIATSWSTAFEMPVTVAVAGDADSVQSTVRSQRGIREVLAPLARVAGRDRFESLQRDDFRLKFSRVCGLVVSSRPQSPYAAGLTRAFGRPFAAISPLDRLPWYQPPKGLAMAEEPARS
jgi:uncharacterized protein (DUF58 family)